MADAPKGGGPLSDLYWLLGFLAVLFFIWYATGGPQRTPEQAPLIEFEGGEEGRTDTSELSALRQSQAPLEERRRIQGAIEDLEWQLGRVEEEVEEAQLKGVVSPFEGLVRITEWSNGQADVAQEEYIALEADFGNDVDLNLTGWKLESRMTGNSGIIGYTTELPITGRINSQTPLILPPGGQAIIVTGSSPIGTSFRVNECAGYLEQFQNFKPELSSYCPRGADEFDDFFDEDTITPLDQKETAYDVCRDFVSTIPQCTIYRKDLRDVEPKLHSACQSFIRSHLSYQGCIASHQYETDFYKDEWRMYLGNRSELWRDRREIIRLLDAQGRTVDIYTY